MRLQHLPEDGGEQDAELGAAAKDDGGAQVVNGLFRRDRNENDAAQPLSAEEQEIHEVTSSEDIEEKVKWLEGQLKAMVEEGQWTMAKQQQHRWAKDRAANELDVATAEGKTKESVLGWRWPT